MPDDTTTTTRQLDTALAAATQSLPEVKDALVPYHEATGDERKEIESLISQIDIRDTSSIIFFGAKAQQQLTTISDQMLEGVRNKDVGPAGEALNDMVSTLRGFHLEELDPNHKPTLFARLLGRAKPVAKFLQQYEQVRKQIDRITDELEQHKVKLLTDITSLDRLYTANLEYFHTLERYIAAGREKLRQLDEELIPSLQKEAEGSADVLKAQGLRDLRSARDDLERRVHDLALTRQVTMQSLPSIRLVQENDKGLVTKINSTLANTVPLWRQQLATAVTIFRSGEAARAVKGATDLTNELLERNAETLKTANVEARTQIERGVFDIESVKKANQTLIATIEDSLRIADEGKRARAAAEKDLVQTETALREALAAAASRSTAGSGGAPGR
jgi:uncharacterized protein YaaN involved in tellurite resistance